MHNVDQTAKKIGSALVEAERSTSYALQSAGLLLAAMAGAHIDADLPLETDHECLEQMASSISAQLLARRQYVEMHRRMAALARKFCPDTLAEGDCSTRPSGTLQMVPSRAA